MIPKIVFFGTPQFAVTVLRFLMDHCRVLAVVTRVDKPRKRSGSPVFSPVKQFAEKKRIPILQPGSCSGKECEDILSKLGADFFVVVAYGEIIRKNILDIPKLGCINLHAGLLPAYRGAAPIQRAIMNGESLSGLTVIQMDPGMDSGDILSQLTLPIEDDMTSGRLAEVLSEKGGPLLIETMEGLSAGRIKGKKQDAALVSFAPKILKEESRISWDAPAVIVYNKMRALLPNNPSWTPINLKDKECKLFFHKITRDDCDYAFPPGTFLRLSKHEMVIVCSKGAIRPLELQIESKKIININDFLNGTANSNLLLSL